MKNHPSFLIGVPEVFILMGNDAMSQNNLIQFLQDATPYPKRTELSNQNQIRNSTLMTPEHSIYRLKETEITSENSHFTAISILSINNNLTTNVRF
jgi:hypothetical protein